MPRMPRRPSIPVERHFRFLPRAALRILTCAAFASCRLARCVFCRALPFASYRMPLCASCHVLPFASRRVLPFASCYAQHSIPVECRPAYSAARRPAFPTECFLSLPVERLHHDVEGSIPPRCWGTLFPQRDSAGRGLLVRFISAHRTYMRLACMRRICTRWAAVSWVKRIGLVPARRTEPGPP